MSEKFTPRIVPILASDCFDRDGAAGWASRVKSAARANGEALRLSGTIIEAKSLYSNQWQPIMLPGGGIHFTDTNEAGLIMNMITGATEIPNVVT